MRKRKKQWVQEDSSEVAQIMHNFTATVQHKMNLFTGLNLEKRFRVYSLTLFVHLIFLFYLINNLHLDWYSINIFKYVLRTGLWQVCKKSSQINEGF